MDKHKITAMRAGGQKLAAIRSQLVDFAQPGVNLKAIDDLAQELITKSGGKSGFMLVPGYHWATCININDGIVHGIPHSEITIKSGDVVSLDVGLFYQGYHTDTSTSFIAGTPTPAKQHFLQIGKKALKLAILEARPGNHVGHISQALQTVIESAGYNSARNLTGHGVGIKLHLPPAIPCFLDQPISATPQLTLGMTIAIEAIYTEGSPLTRKLADGWTLATQDGKLAGLFEETVLITGSGPQILT